jgi:hypothetical protein
MSVIGAVVVVVVSIVEFYCLVDGCVLLIGVVVGDSHSQYLIVWIARTAWG